MFLKPRQIPSGYFITDVYLYLDAMFRRRLFHPDRAKHESRSTLAAEEAMRTKKCLQALRYLWRNSQERSHDPQVQALKEHLVASPQQQRNQELGDVPPQHGHPALDDGGDGEGPEGAQAHNEEGSSEGAFSEGAEEEEEAEEDPCLASYDGGGDLIDENSQQVIANHHHDDAGEVSSSPHTVEDVSSDDIGEESSVDMRDSQVGGWMGQFYARYGRFGKTEKSYPNMPKFVKEDNRPRILQNIRKALDSHAKKIGAHFAFASA